MIKINPPQHLHGILRVPGDRSITVRALLLGSIAAGASVVRQYLECDDTAAAMGTMRALGVEIDASRQTNGDLRIAGVGLHGLRAPTPGSALYCGSSGTTMRLLAGLMAGQSFPSTLDGSAQLRQRPMRRISEPLSRMGARISDTSGCAPLAIEPSILHGIDYAMPVASAQVKSALLLAALYADGDIVIHEATPTRDHTERMLGAMGVDVRYQEAEGGGATLLKASSTGKLKSKIHMRASSTPLRPLEFTLPGDFSSAAFFLVAGAIHPSSRIELPRIGLNPTRTGLLEALRAMGAQIQIDNAQHQGGEPAGDVLVTSGGLRAIEVGGHLSALMIDEFPVFCVAATQAAGTTVVRDAQELRVKESNRIDGLVKELRKMGAQIEATPDGFIVAGPASLHGAIVDAHDDHRIAMALAVAGLIAQGETTITGAECVSKTYPRFFGDLTTISHATGSP